MCHVTTCLQCCWTSRWVLPPCAYSNTNPSAATIFRIINLRAPVTFFSSINNRRTPVTCYDFHLISCNSRDLPPITLWTVLVSLESAAFSLLLPATVRPRLIIASPVFTVSMMIPQIVHTNSSEFLRWMDGEFVNYIACHKGLRKLGNDDMYYVFSSLETKVPSELMPCLKKTKHPYGWTWGK